VSDERGLACCGNCGDGWTALERKQRQSSDARATVEHVLSELVEDCLVCWAEGRVLCKSQRADNSQKAKTQEVAGAYAIDEGRCCSETLEVRFDQDTHSCFRCGLSQKFCNTGQSTGADCQWPGVAGPMLQTIRRTRKGAEILERWDFLRKKQLMDMIRHMSRGSDVGTRGEC